MFPLVEFCISNMAKGGDYVYDKLESDPSRCVRIWMSQ